MFYFLQFIMFRYLLCITCSFLLTSCSFQPLIINEKYKPNSQNCALTIQVNKKGYASFNLKNRLEQKKGLIEGRLQSNAHLDITLSEEFTALNVVNARVSNRNNGRISVDIALIYTNPETNQKEKKSTRLDCISSYDLDEDEQFAAQQTKDSVRNRLINSLTDEIIKETLYLLE